MFILRQNGLQKARLGLIVAKKNLSKAVLRNYVKRKLRELFRYHQTELKNLDIIWLAQKNMSQLSKEALSHYLETQWQKLLNQLTG